MKLQSMRLPTGEFMLVASEARYNHDLPEALRTVKENVGAAAFFITDQAVEIEDAVVDSDARRVEYPAEDDGAQDSGYDPSEDFLRVYMPNVDIPSFEVDGDGNATLTGEARAAGWTDIGHLTGREMSMEFTIGPEDLAITRALMEGREVSPAGVVKGQEGDPTYTEDDLAGEPTPEAYFPTEGDVVGDEDEPLGQEVPIQPWDATKTIRVNDQTVAQVPYTFKPGDEVLVNGTSYLQTRVRDLEATVVEEHQAGALWRSTQREGYTVLVRDDQNRFMYFKPADVTLVKED